jgi:para-aminobenzoate synthetase component 1
MQENTETYLLECLLKKVQHSAFVGLFLSNGFEDRFGRWRWLLGCEILQETTDLSQLTVNAEAPWMGYISYDYKNEIEPLLQSENAKLSGFLPTKFIKPKTWVGMDREGVLHGNPEGKKMFRDLQSNLNQSSRNPDDETESSVIKINWEPLTSRESYLNKVAQIKAHIVEGDFYEMNHCIAFGARAEIDPVNTFVALNRKAPAPFAVFVKDGDQYLLCASPERFVAQRGEMLVSQPIKGTRKRVKVEGISGDQQKVDEVAVTSLKNSIKDRAENVMIVDLVRNDLSRVCEPGTVMVPELCEVYSFSHVHQMISTVVGKRTEDAGFKDVVHATFPMGSMTGAPKIAVMQHTETMENFARGIYSGSVGYAYQGEADLNVVIRSLVYDGQRKQLSYAVGGAITIDSIAEEEYQECLDKAATVLSIFDVEMK